MDITRKKSLIAPLTYLKATIDLGSYTKAAEYLGTTESRLSKEIKAFEKNHEDKTVVSLFRRHDAHARRDGNLQTGGTSGYPVL